MNTRRIGFSVLCLLSQLFVVGCEKGNKSQPVPVGSNRLIHISAVTGGEAASVKSCEVDYPITVVRVSQNPHIQWHSDDNAYTVQFVSYTNGPSPENPFGDSNLDRVPVRAKSDSDFMKISKDAGGYYKYRILDADGNVCKNEDDDRDTGVNVKR